MNSLFTHDSARVLAMGVGSLGCLAAKYGADHHDAGTVAWCAAHIRSVELIATGLDKKLFLKSAGMALTASGLARSIEADAGTFEKLLCGRDSVVLCGELSDPLVPTLIEGLEQAVSARSIRVFVLLIEPFVPSREMDLEILEACRERLEYCVQFMALLNAGLEGISAGVAVKRIQMLAAQRLAEAAHCFGSALDFSNENTRCLHGLRGRHRAVFTAGEGTAAALAAVERALAGLDEVARACVATAVIQSPTELSVREASAILRKIYETNANAGLVSVTRPAPAERAECLLLSGPRKSANVVSIGAAVDESPTTVP